MKPNVAICLLSCVLLVFQACSASPERDAWLQRHRDVIDNAHNDPSPAHIHELGRVIGAMKLHEKKYSPDALALFQQAKETMMAIPGYAEYYRDRILDARAKMEAEPDQALRDDMYHRTMANAVGGFGILGLLPSPASVRVLGDFLSDERGRFILSPEEAKRDIERRRYLFEVRQANCEYAVSSLNYMPIEDKPIKKDRVTFNDVPAWREWYERVKSGRATFRFEGDPVEYDLDGPAPPEKLARIAADRKRDAERENRRTGPAAGDETSSSKGDTPAEGASPVSRLLLLMAGGFLAVVLGWYLFRRIKRDPA